MQGETIICLATRRWDSLWRNTQQVMWRLARDNHVYFFEPGRDPDKAHGSEMVRNAAHLFKLDARRVTENLTVITTPPNLPYLRRQLSPATLKVATPIIARINAQLVAGHVHRAMRRYKITNPILWLYEPRHVHLVGQFGEKLVCHYNYDEFANFAGNERIKPILLHYDELVCRKSDLVFASSSGQAERRRAFNPHTYFIPNAVDFDLFNRALAADTPVAPDIAAIRGPIIGFAGWMGYQMDLDLVVATAEAYPDCSVVLVGPDALPANEQRVRLRHLPNVHFLGRKELATMPSYLKAFDVALIPYVLHGHTTTVYPLKLHEYLAAGRPVVATALPELRPYAGVVTIASDRADFVTRVGAALQEHDSAAVARRVAVARENTWEQRLEEIRRILDSHLTRRTSGGTTQAPTLSPL